VLLGLAVGVGPAAAGPVDGFGQACRYDYFTYNACLTIIPSTHEYSVYSVTVGIDLKMPGNQAKADLLRGSSFRTGIISA
jgi:hypothetical protein